MFANHIIVLINWNLVKDGDAVRRVLVPQQDRHLHLPAELRPAKHIINVFFDGNIIIFFMKFGSDTETNQKRQYFLSCCSQRHNLLISPKRPSYLFSADAIYGMED